MGVGIAEVTGMGWRRVGVEVGCVCVRMRERSAVLIVKPPDPYLR